MLLKRLSTYFVGGYFLASVFLKDKMIFLTISNSIPHVNGVSGSECVRSIALEIFFSITYTRDSSCSLPSNLKLSPRSLASGILRMKGMKIEMSQLCICWVTFKVRLIVPSTLGMEFSWRFFTTQHVSYGRVSIAAFCVSPSRSHAIRV